MIQNKKNILKYPHLILKSKEFIPNGIKRGRVILQYSLVPDRTFHVPLGFFFANESLEKKIKRRRGSGMPAWRTDVAKSSRGEGRGGGGGPDLPRAKWEA